MAVMVTADYLVGQFIYYTVRVLLLRVRSAGRFSFFS
jgi:hypothetical protein